MTECRDIVTHQTCSHGGWIKVEPRDVGIDSVNAAREAANLASEDLGLGAVRLLFFKPGRAAPQPYSPCDPIVHLHAGFYDPGMMGKACHPEKVKPLTVWIRADHSAPATAYLVVHEVRHLWQLIHHDHEADEADEADADNYAARSVLRLDFTVEELTAMLRELGYNNLKPA